MKLLQAAFYSFLFTIFGASWYYLFGLAVTLSQGGDLSKFLWDTFTGSIICFGFLTYVFYELQGAFERMNQRGRRDEDDKNDPPAPPPGHP